MMTLSIRDPEVDSLARKLAQTDGVTITAAVKTALKETLVNRRGRVDPVESAKDIIARHGLTLNPNRRPVPQSAYHDLDHDLIGENE